MADRDDAPPREAMAHMMRMLPPLETGMAFAALRTLPDAARWHLIAWLADGLEPTIKMRMALSNAVANHVVVDGNGGLEISGGDEHAIITAALAAAKETRDEP